MPRPLAWWCTCKEDSWPSLATCRLVIVCAVRGISNPQERACVRIHAHGRARVMRRVHVRSSVSPSRGQANWTR
eukprot:scaffold111700_cov35-Tisochrysis_lutea.AAC.2